MRPSAEPPALPRARPVQVSTASASPAVEPPVPASPPVASARNDAVPLPPPSSAPASKAVEVLDQRYQKQEALGSGPLGITSKGRFNALGLDVCIKELKDIFGYFSFLQRGEVLKRLKRELCAQAQVRHPGIVQVLDQNVEAARPYYVLELLQGNLKSMLDEGGARACPCPSRCAASCNWPMRCAPRTPWASPTTTSSRRMSSSTSTATRSSVTSG
ncbi:hypothetical protein ACN28S_67025 [Cystobacter fuscus]